MRKRGLGVGWIAVALVVSYLLGIHPMTVPGHLTGGSAVPQTRQDDAQKPQPDDMMARFVSAVLADTQNVWTSICRRCGHKPVLMFRQSKNLH